MKNTVEVVCRVKVDVGITLWQAIKLRIAGKAYMPIAEQIAKSVAQKMERDNP